MKKYWALIFVIVLVIFALILRFSRSHLYTIEHHDQRLKSHHYAVNALNVTLSVVDGKWDGNCLSPPYYDGDCCKESIFDDDVPIVKTCAQKFNLTLNANNDVIPTLANIDSYVCFTDCVYVTGKYINNGAVDLPFIKNDITAEAKNFTELGTVLYNAIEKCSKSLDKVTDSVKAYPNSDKYLKGKCSPTAQLIDDCSDMEYYISCPAKYWTTNPDCDDIKAYATKCRLLKA